MKRIIACLLCLMMLLPAGITASAQDGGSGTMRVIAFNVSGIPLVGDFQGSVFTTTIGRAKLIGRMLNETDVDFIGTEEDFNAADYLASQMTAYPYRSFTSGGVAQGQGMNVYASHPLYNVKRVKWDREYGFLSGSTDALSNKGFIYCLMELEDGVFVHMINVHMDAGYDPISICARAENFRQLAAFITDELDDGRALIVQGDFNFKFKRMLKDDMLGNLLDPVGLTDVWAEVYNNGITDVEDPDYDWDVAGDDLDRILYRSGEDLSLTAVSKTVPDLTGENGERYTDHNPMLTEFTYTVTGSLPAPETLAKPVPVNEALLNFKEVLWTFLRLLQAFLGIFELPYLAYQGVEMLANGKMP